jgi:2,3-diketo-5-methylthiopentyl-1-phosphate enolase
MSTIFDEPVLTATYQLEFPPEEMTTAKLEQAAEHIAVGQTIGTHKSKEVGELQSYLAKVVSIRILAPDTPDRHYHRAIVKIAFPLKVIHCDLGTLLSVTFGKVSMSGRIRLIDMDFPPELCERFPGPRFGVEGIRQKLDVRTGPLLMSIFKPCLGVSEEKLAEKIYSQAVGGIHIVKDDEILSDPDFSSARRRLEACLKAIHRPKRKQGELCSMPLI